MKPDSSEAVVASQKMSLQTMKFAGQAIKFEFISGQSGAIERSVVEEGHDQICPKNKNHPGSLERK